MDMEAGRFDAPIYESFAEQTNKRPTSWKDFTYDRDTGKTNDDDLRIIGKAQRWVGNKRPSRRKREGYLDRRKTAREKTELRAQQRERALAELAAQREERREARRLERERALAEFRKQQQQQRVEMEERKAHRWRMKPGRWREHILSAYGLRTRASVVLPMNGRQEANRFRAMLRSSNLTCSFRYQVLQIDDTKVKVVKVGVWPGCGVHPFVKRVVGY
jgi:hypothetical protein